MKVLGNDLEKQLQAECEDDRQERSEGPRVGQSLSWEGQVK